MPLYEYECERCGHRFERIQKFSDPLVTACPVCEGPVRKLFSSPAIQFKGTGWYITDSRKPAAGGGDTAETSAKEKKDGSPSKSDGKPSGTSTDAKTSPSSSGSSGSSSGSSGSSSGSSGSSSGSSRSSRSSK